MSIKKSFLVPVVFIAFLAAGFILAWKMDPSSNTEAHYRDNPDDRNEDYQSELREPRGEGSATFDPDRSGSDRDGERESARARQVERIDFNADLPNTISRYREEWKGGDAEAGWKIANIYGQCTQAINSYYLDSLRALSENANRIEEARDARERLNYLNDVAEACEALDTDQNEYVEKFEDWTSRAAESGHHAAMRHLATSYPQSVIASNQSEEERQEAIYEHDQRRIEYFERLRSECDSQGILEIGTTIAVTDPFMSSRVSKERLYFGNADDQGSDEPRVQAFAHRYAGLVLKERGRPDEIARNWSQRSNLSPHLESVGKTLGEQIVDNCTT